MEKEKSKFIAEKDSNPRGKLISIEEIRQCIINIKSYYANNMKNLICNTTGVSKSDLSDLKINLKSIPISLEEILLNIDGKLHLHDSFVTLNAKQIIECVEDHKIYGFWNNNYLPFAKDNEGCLLILEIDTENKQEKNIVSWSRDSGVIEQIDESLGLFLERFSNKLINKEFEYVEGMGLVEIN